jgi:hypothetical protein
MRRLLVALALVATVGCEAESQPIPPAQNALVGPWQQVPIPLAGPILAAVDRACRGSMPDFPPEVRLAVVDARGGGLIQAHYVGPNSAEATCLDMSVDPAGRVEASGGGSTGSGGQGAPPMEALALEAGGGSGSDRSSVTYGRAGAGIAKVMLIVPGQPPIVASLANGWYIAWWPGKWPPKMRIVGLDAIGRTAVETTFP